MLYTKENIKLKKRLNIYVITLSDRASKGIYEDKSGIEIENRLKSYFLEKAWNIDLFYKIIPDEPDLFKNEIVTAVGNGADIIFSTGSTGVGPRDIAPDVVIPLLDKELPGIMELIRVKYGMTIPNAVLSRSVAGFIGQAQIYCLPGSVKAVNDYMNEILKTLEHLIYMYYGIDIH